MAYFSPLFTVNAAVLCATFNGRSVIVNSVRLAGTDTFSTELLVCAPGVGMAASSPITTESDVHTAQAIGVLSVMRGSFTMEVLSLITEFGLSIGARSDHVE